MVGILLVLIELLKLEQLQQYLLSSLSTLLPLIDQGYIHKHLVCLKQFKLAKDLMNQSILLWRLVHQLMQYFPFLQLNYHSRAWV